MIAMRMRNFDFCSYFKQLNLESVRQSLMSAFYSVTCFFSSVIFLSLAEEKKLVEEVFNNAIDCLSDEDKALPQVC